jgi:hypothetical protein
VLLQRPGFTISPYDRAHVAGNNGAMGRRQGVIAVTRVLLPLSHSSV